MDTTNFYVALYDANSDTVSFPFAVEEGKRREPVAEWASRKAGHGLTERIIHYRVPLLIPNSFDEWMQAHANEVKPIGQPAKSWLGVPLVTGNQVIGIIAVQSHQQENLYDHHDLTTLSTIASQTAIAISNARLFKSAQRQIGELSLDRVVG